MGVKLYMNDDELSSKLPKSWLKKLTLLLTGEPKNRNELFEILKDAANRHLIDNDTFCMFEGVLNVQELRVKDVMFPRSQMVFIDHQSPFPFIVSKVVKSGHSRFPVIGDNKDEIIGILLAKDLLAYSSFENENFFNIQDILRPAVFIPENKRLDSLLQDFQNKRSHMAIVVDEYGSMAGLITIEDVLEQIVGNIEDEFDIDHNPLIKKHHDDTFTIKALTTIEEFNDFFNSYLDDNNVETIGGLVVKCLGHLPKYGEFIKIKGYCFKVLMTDHRRIYLLQLSFYKQK